MNTATSLKVEHYADRVVKVIDKASNIALKFACIVATVTGSVLLAFILLAYAITQNAGAAIGKVLQAVI